LSVVVLYNHEIKKAATLASAAAAAAGAVEGQTEGAYLDDTTVCSIVDEWALNVITKSPYTSIGTPLGQHR